MMLPILQGSELITAHLGSCPPIDQLQADWHRLEARAKSSFFTSWTWIGSWLASLPAEQRPSLLSARQGDVIVGLALVGRRTSHRHFQLCNRGLYLNATGDAEIDEITTEYNGILVDQAACGGVEQAMLDHLLAAAADWDELYLPGVLRWPQGVVEHPTAKLIDDERAVFWVDLQRVRENQGDYLGLLAHKPRYQVRKTEKSYAKLGAIEVSIACGVDEMLEYFEALKALHQPYWIERGRPGAFSSAYACEFHHRMIRAGAVRDEIQLLRVTVAGRPLGYLYNLVHDGHVCNYQTGFDYRLLDGTDSPGLVCHARAVALNAESGNAIYDFMAGDQRYKRALSTNQASLHWGVLRRPRLKFQAEDWLRALKQRLMRTSETPASTA